MHQICFISKIHNFMNYFLKCLREYANFNGRARRSEYWFFALFQFLIVIGIYIIGAIVEAITKANGAVFWIFYGIAVLFSLAMFIPQLAVSVRRLHDIGKSGVAWLINFIPLVGGIIFLVWCCTDSQPFPNQYGPNPKGIDLSENQGQPGVYPGDGFSGEV